MKGLKSYELREKYLQFFKERGHAVIASASLIPENDPTVLFTTAGMHPLVPYLMGQKHPEGTRLCDVQKCVRTVDIDEVGDESHCTFFEMLGNWSLGDYFKKESIAWSYQFLTEVLGIDPNRLAISVFAGDEDAPRDEESASYWQTAGIKKEQIFYLPKKNNWWGPAGITGPCGPDTEIFIDTGKQKCGADCSPACDCGKYLEIWNNVFMQYFKNADNTFTPLQQKNVDTGMGLERTVATLNGLSNVYETDLFADAMALIEEHTTNGLDREQNVRAMRIVADHTRTATFLLGDPRSVTPSNVDQGYILRRLIRRAIRLGRKLGLEKGFLCELSALYAKQYQNAYPELWEKKDFIAAELAAEEEKFLKTLEQGEKELEKVLSFIKGDTLNGKTAFRLYDTYGFPIEITAEICAEKGFKVDLEGYYTAEKEHQQKSKMGAEQKFKGGLADNSEQTARLHTATHLLLAALRSVLGDTVFQRGSNITAERLRFDFNFDRALTKEELEKVETLVNDAIQKDIPVVCEEMTVEQAKAQGAMGIFESKYGEKVKVYTVENVSKEICGGPHAARTGELKEFKIVKEQSSSAGVRRIKAVIGQC